MNHSNGEETWRHARHRRWLLILAISLIVAAGSFAEVQTGKQVLVPQRIDLAERLDTSHREKTGRYYPDLRVFEVGFDCRRSIRQEVPSTLIFAPIPAGGDQQLVLSLALHSSKASSPAGSATAVVTCRNREREVELIREHLSPLAEGDDPQWIERLVPLQTCPGPFATLVFTTEGGPEIEDGQHLFWGEPHVTTHRTAEIRASRIILLVSIDTLRADRMELYGGPATTPNLMRLAKDSAVFDDAVAPSPWTIPSHASLFTSTYPHVHGITSDQAIPGDLITVASQFSGAGWTSAGFVDSPMLRSSGFPRGFHHYDASAPPLPLSRWGAGFKKQRVVDWISNGAAENLFIFWHIMDVHPPYGARAPFAGRLRKSVNPRISSFPPLSEFRKLGYYDFFQLDRYRNVEDLIAGYDEGISMVDHAVGELLDFLIAAGLYENATIIITSDHGESLFDHGIWIGHGLFLTEDEIHVPLILKLPGNRHASRRVTEMVRLIDVAPTILDMHGVNLPDSFQGLSLVPLLNGHLESAPLLAYGSSSVTGAHYVRSQADKYVTAWTLPRDEMIQRYLYPRGQEPLFMSKIEDGELLFDLEHDPAELNNIVEEMKWRDLLAVLRQRALDTFGSGSDVVSPRGEQAGPALSDEEIERLRALGYLPYGS